MNLIHLSGGNKVLAGNVLISCKGSDEEILPFGDFITATAEADLRFIIKTSAAAGGEGKNVIFSWGDGQVDTVAFSGNAGGYMVDITHTYTTPAAGTPVSIKIADDDNSYIYYFRCVGGAGRTEIDTITGNWDVIAPELDELRVSNSPFDKITFSDAEKITTIHAAYAMGPAALDLTNLINLEYLTVGSNPRVTEIDISTNTKISYLNAAYTDIDVNTVNHIGLALDSFGLSNGTVYVQGNPAPTGAGLAAYTNLTAKGWTVSHA